MKVSNAWGVLNQFIIWLDDGTEYFQSYNSIIVMRKGSKITLDKYCWNFSKTTGKYRNKFLGESKKDTERCIKAGVYKLADLNQ